MTNASSAAEGGWIGCNVDFGAEQTIELDYRRPADPWLSIGSGIGAADVWLQGRSGLPAIRFRIERNENGLRVYLDRGDQSNVWWPKDGPPQLSVVFDQRTATATASTSVGMGHDFQEVGLGTTAY